MTARQWRMALLLIFVLALVPRFMSVAVYHAVPTLLNDAGWYDFFGKSIADGSGYSLPDGTPTARWPPGYPFFVGAIYSVTGSSLLALLSWQAILGAATAVITAELGRRIDSVRTGIIAGATFALIPTSILYSSLVMSEVLFTFLIAAAILAAICRPTWSVLLSAGLFGLAMLTRSQAVVLIAPVFIWLMVLDMRRTDTRRAVRSMIIIVLGTAAVLTPWTIRNIVRLDTAQPVATNSGINLLIGNHRGASGGLEDPPIDKISADLVGIPNPRAEVLLDRRALRAAWSSIRDDPGAFLARAPKKIVKTYDTDASFARWYQPFGSDSLSVQERANIDDISNTVYVIIMVLAAGSALLLLLARRTSIIIPGVSIILWTLVSVVFFGDPRFHVPMFPMLSLLAGLGVSAAAAFVGKPDVSAPTLT